MKQQITSAKISKATSKTVATPVGVIGCVQQPSTWPDTGP
jgi:hypothetical protein